MVLSSLTSAIIITHLETIANDHRLAVEDDYFSFFRAQKLRVSRWSIT